ncbi:hypothetical protein HMPREF9946_03136 [Acetobacteraceae bacterium AT-5844]|nr:hypothetical protein HMPREF9946_03136 [Acetobacteraceae bacterium AT-5844]
MLTSDFVVRDGVAPGLPGLLYDSGFTDKVTVPCGATAQPFGTLVAYVSATGISVLPIGTNPIVGVALKDDAIASDGYVQYDAMTVVRRGRVWALASGTCTKDAVAKYAPATGVFADAGTATLANAKFLSGNITVPAFGPGGTSVQIVLVELHDPSVDATGA